jgi:hypothetical protein
MTINLPGKLFGIIFISISLLLLAACNSAKSGSSTTTNTPVTTVSVLTISTTTTEAADDIVFVPAGIEVYRAQINPPNQFGTIQTTSVTKGNSANAVYVSYRDNIETKAGEIRNNIIYITQNTIINNAFLSVTDLPVGITAKVDAGVYNSNFQPGWEQIIEFNISSGLNPGSYNFNIDVMVDGIDYGTIPCTLKVTS